METEYKYSFGRTDQIISEALDKFDSLDELDYSPDTGLIIVPKVIGVYQEDDHLRSKNLALEFFDTNAIFLATGEKEEIPFGLISLIYDSTIINEDVLRSSIKGDALKRLKYAEYSDEIPNFYEKKVPGIDIVRTTILDPSEKNKVLLKRTIEHLQLAKMDYGLTRLEALFLKASGQLVKILEGSSGLITDPLSLKIETSMLKFFKSMGLEDFFKRENKD